MENIYPPPLLTKNEALFRRYYFYPIDWERVPDFTLTHLPEAWDKQKWIWRSENYETFV